MRVKFTFCLHFGQEYYMGDALSPEYDIVKHQMLVCLIIGDVMFDHLVNLFIITRFTLRFACYTLFGLNVS